MTAQRDTQHRERNNKLIQNYGWNTSKERLFSKGTYIATTSLASFLSQYKVAVGTAWPLLGSHRNGQATLYLFQKHVYTLFTTSPIYGAPILLCSVKRGHFVGKAAGLPTHFHLLQG